MKLRKNQNAHTLLRQAWKYMSWVKRHEKLNSGFTRCYTCGRFIDPEEADLGHYEHHGMSSNGYGTNMIDWIEKGLRVQCKPCNHDPHRKIEAGKVFTRKLIQEYGDSIIDELKAYKKIFWKPSIDEALEKLNEWKVKFHSPNRVTK